MADVAEATNAASTNDAPAVVEEPDVEESITATKSAEAAGEAENECNNEANNESDKESTIAAKQPATKEDKAKQERAIIRQVEYYFGDANLQRDKFLLEQISKDEEGWVPFSVLLTFKRLASLSTDVDIIVDALLKSDEGLLEISEDRQKVRRHPERPLPEHNEERRKEIQTRTAYAKHFPLDATISELVDFFSGFEKVVNVSMRKYLNKPTKTYHFKGSVFVTFETIDQAKAFIEKDKVEYKGRELLRKWQTLYLEEKREEKKQKGDTNGKHKKKEKVEAKPIELPKNAVIYFEGTADDEVRENIREALEKVESDQSIAFVDFGRGRTNGFVRFADPDSADKFLEKVVDNKVKLNDEVTLTVRKATEEEEKQVLEKGVEFLQRRRIFNQDKKSHRFSNRKRFGNNKYDGGSKKAKTEQ